MYRYKIEELKKWKNSDTRKPLIIRGARQVGKTWLMKEFGEKNYEKWRKGQIDYLERVCRGNLNKLSKIIDEIFKYAKDKNLKVSTSFYRKYGKGKKTKLRFSKFGKERGREKIFNCIY